MPNTKFISAPSATLKRRLLRESQALLITSMAEETSSLVAMEAATSGTPVVAFRRGSLAEVVRDGMTGFLVEGPAEAVLSLQNIVNITPKACLHYAQENFSAVKMSERYSHLYQRFADLEQLIPFAAETA
jgi:glycosyltransferase involved in cell wall biosynthesis